MDIKAVIFDLDGTLVKFALDITNARKEAITEIKRIGINAENLDNLNVYLMLKIIKSRTDANTYLKLKQSVWRIVEKFELKASKGVNIQPDALNTLVFIKRLGLKLALVTNNGRKATYYIIKKFNFDNFFDAIITREDSKELKPDGLSIGRSIKILGIKSQEAIYVGDSVIDVLAAKKAGVISVALPTGISRISDLVKTKPDFIIGSLQDMMDLINRYFHS